MYESRVREIERLLVDARRAVSKLDDALLSLRLVETKKDLVKQIIEDISKGKNLEYIERIYLGEEDDGA